MCFITPLSTLKWCSFVEWTYSNSCTPQLCVCVCEHLYVLFQPVCQPRNCGINGMLAELCDRSTRGGTMAAWNKSEMQCNCMFSARRSVIVAVGGGFSVPMNTVWLCRALWNCQNMLIFGKFLTHRSEIQIKPAVMWILVYKPGQLRRSLSTWSNVLLFVLIARLLFGCLYPRNFKMVTCISPNGYMPSSGRLHTGWTVPLS